MAELIDQSVAAAVAGETRVAVSFSGGLDSSVIAKCAAGRAEVVAVAGFSDGSGDEARAKDAATALGVDLVAARLTAENVADALREIDLPFEPTLMDKGLWCLYSIVSRSARDAGAKVMLLGQLADELFGGYAKYADALKARGSGAAASMMSLDVQEYAARGRIRDVRACRLVQPRFPFEAKALVDFASGLPVSYKIRDGVRKAVLREAAIALGVPEAQAEAGKKAAQYSSGVQKLVVGSRF